MTGRRAAKQPHRQGDPQTLGAALSELFALKGYAGSNSNAELAAAWNEIAGDRFAQRTRVMGIHRGVLQVAVSSSAMMNELASFHQPRLVNDLQAKRPDWKIKAIKFRLRGDLAGPPEKQG